MIQATGVTKTFRTGTGEVLAVDNVNLSVTSGEFVLILGRSGSGKSTLLAMLAGLISPTTGRVRIHGNEIGNLSVAEPRSAALKSDALVGVCDSRIYYRCQIRFAYYIHPKTLLTWGESLPISREVPKLSLVY